MGEIQADFVDGVGDTLPFEFDTQSKDFQTITTVGDKIYVIGGSNDEMDGIDVRIYDKPDGKWDVPTILGTKPAQCIGHSAVLLNNDRILVLKKDSTPDDCTWFLEVDTPYVREKKEKMETEVVAWSKGVKAHAPKPIVISGPSGVGKGTLISKLMKEFPSTFGFSVSHTTRAPREKEIDGVHYHFSERTLMEKEIRDGKFLESASVHGNLYGTSVEAVEVVSDAGKRCVLDIDVQGARSVRACSLDAIYIFICPPSFEELEKRLRARGTESEEQVQKRLRNAKTELEEGKSSGLFDHILVNCDLEKCYQTLKKLLGLDGCAGTTPVDESSVKNVELPSGHSISEVNQKVLIHCVTADPGKKLFVLDVSSLKGGAPGRTRGLNMYAIDPFANCLNGGLKETQMPSY
ncbi:hypothetical protein MKX01_018506 [Papaver californicum]|nr:hypothetical protein MKX01_018506 [Papaver californicum]